jgi:ABC-type Fe3+/spermidine/putrescine transport system ATPase subunit
VADAVKSTDLVLTGLTKRFGDFAAVDALDLTVPAGSFFALLGPSGCGKTTTLRMVAGLEVPTAGSISLAGDEITQLKPYRRPVNTVFQSYALFPHLTIRDNVAFGPRRKGSSKRDAVDDVNRMLDLVELSEYAARKPAQLSGGQQQRVALARALINSPQVLLLDEPLGALDLKLREEMQIELKSIQQEVGITFIYVTHDQEEALTMSDRLAVFNHGRIEQIGSPASVYERPATQFVAGFVGTSNLLTGDAAATIVGTPGTFTVRPEKIRIADPGTVPDPDEIGAPGRIEKVVYLGPDTRYHVALDAGAALVVTQQNLATTSTEALAQEGREVRLIWKRHHCRPVSDERQDVEEENRP